MSIIKSGLLLLSGAAIGAVTVCELIRRRNDSKTYEVSLIKGLDHPGDSTKYQVKGQLCTMSSSPFRMSVIQDFVLRVEAVDNTVIFTPIHTDLEVVMLVKECMGVNQLNGVLEELGWNPVSYTVARTGEGWKATVIPSYKAPTPDDVVEVPVSEPVKEAKADLRRAQPLKP